VLRRAGGPCGHDGDRRAPARPRRVRGAPAAIDWLSRPPADVARVFGDKPVALMGATPGASGTRLAQSAWLPVLRTLGTRAWAGRQLYVGGATQVFDAQGQLADAKIDKLLNEFMAGFVAFVKGNG
jgi:NAD(P)H-dependent FMN reductase